MAAFRSGTYSPFGSLHIIQDVIEKSNRYEAEFTGQFLVPAGRTGVIHASVIVRRIQPDATPKIVQTGTLSATHGAAMLVTVADGDGPWTDES